MRNRVIALLLMAPFSLDAKSCCLDKSYHAYKCTIEHGCCPRDYKTLHPVDCACPCDQYPQIEEFGRCMKCKHFRRPTEYS